MVQSVIDFYARMQQAIIVICTVLENFLYILKVSYGQMPLDNVYIDIAYTVLFLSCKCWSHVYIQVFLLLYEYACFGLTVPTRWRTTHQTSACVLSGVVGVGIA